MLNTLHEWCIKWRLFNDQEKRKKYTSKTCSCPKTQLDFQCAELALEKESTYKYLGLWFHEHLDMKFAVIELTKLASCAHSALYMKISNVGGMDFDVFCKLYECLIEPMLLYGAGLWGSSEQKRVNTVQNKACQYFLGLGKNASNHAYRATWVGPVVPISRR